MAEDSNFCGTPVMYIAFQFFCLMPITACLLWAILQWDARSLVFIPSVIILYLWFFEDIPWRGRYYGYGTMPGGNLVYSGEEYQCHSCKHIQNQLDCKYGCLVDPVKFAHKDDWRGMEPCIDCSRSGTITLQDRYKGPVRWAEGECP